MWYTDDYDILERTPMSRRKEKQAISVLAAYLRSELDSRGWTVSDLSRSADIAHSTLSHILNKPDVLPTPETIVKIASALGVEAADLTSKIGYAVDRASTPDVRLIRLARSIADRPWLADRADLLLRLSPEEFDELLDLIEFRRNRRRGRQDPDSR
jgi:transcriptional regulator with XRE-family HTH domain